jgi:3-deoxy-D-manno-octulosonic-acid transferase
MGHSLGLTLYNLSVGRQKDPLPAWPERPRGSVIWMHAPRSDAARPLGELARRLVEEDGHAILFSSPDFTRPDPQPPQRGVVQIAPPPDTVAGVRTFLDHFQPALAIMADGELRPALLAEMAVRSLPVLMVDARAPYLMAQRTGWYPGLIRQSLAGIDSVIAVDEAAGRAWIRAGALADRVRAEGRMEEGSRALRCNEAERAALLRQLGTRPVWLAASLPEAEEAAVIAAHRDVLRLAHRMLLVIVPEDPARSDTLARKIEEAEGWTVARRSADQEPDPETEVYLADNPSEFGLWYRLAPISYLGGSLLGPGCLRDPFEPAALGSAIVHGPRAGVWAASFARLAEARAARPLRSAGELGDAVGDLLSPDRAARLARGAWAVSTSGAEVTDRVVQMVREMMEART